MARSKRQHAHAHSVPEERSEIAKRHGHSAPEADVRILAARRQIGDQLKKARTAAGLRQQDLSALSGVGINTITRCERSAISVSLDTLARLADVLNTAFVLSPAHGGAGAEHASPAPSDVAPAPTEGYDLD